MSVLLAVIYIVFVSLGLPDSLFGASWPVVHVDFNVPESFASLYGVIIGVCTGGVSFLAGKLIRKFGTGKVTFFSTLLTALGLVGMSFSPNIVVMMIFAVIMGYGAGAIDTGLNNYVSLHYHARHMNWLHCSWALGVTISPMIMSSFLDGEAGEWRTGYRVVAALQFAFSIIILLTLNKWKDDKGAVSPQEKKDPVPPKRLIDLLKIKGVITSILSLGLYCSAEFMLGTWGATYAVNVFAITPDEAALWISLYFGGIMVGRVISGFVSLKASDNTLVAGGIAVCLLGIVIFALPLGKMSLIGFLLIGIGFGPIFPSVLHSVPARFGSDYSADITGYHMGGAYGIGFALQLVYGYVASATTYKITPFVLMALIAGVFAAHKITLRTLKKQRNDL